jgi:hypothetical protein
MRGIAGALKEPLLACESVLSEAAFHLRSSEFVLSLVSDGMLRVAFDLGREASQVEELVLRYADRKPDLADLSSYPHERDISTAHNHYR